MHSFIVKNIKDLDSVSAQLIKSYPTDKLFIFEGQMGSGKTTLIKIICKQLGVIDTTSSPTFSMINEYRTEKGSKIYHMDFYRIKNLEEVYDMGYEDYFYSDNYCFIEWPEKIAELLPENAVHVNICLQGVERLIITC